MPGPCIREGGEGVGQGFFIFRRIRAIGRGADDLARGVEQVIVERAAFRGQRDAALLDLAEPGGVRAFLPGAVFRLERDRFLKRLERCLAQEDRAFAASAALRSIAFGAMP